MLGEFPEDIGTNSFNGKPSQEDRAIFEEFAKRRPIPELVEFYQIDPSTLERLIQNCCRFYSSFAKCVKSQKKLRGIPDQRDFAIFNDFARGINASKVASKWNVLPSQAGLIIRNVANYYLRHYRNVAGNR